ncbi:MAG: TolC family protein [Chitinophagaceae bacterium]|nr:TolC family protein [Chitinophagaceae bacterium]
MKKLVLSSFVFLTYLWAGAQTLSIETCYQLARQQYPLTKQHELIKQTNQYTIANIASGYLPQLNMNGQATYQSDVTQVPVKIPGMDIPQISKDQYKLYGEAAQTIYDGGVIRQQKNIQNANAAVEEQSLEVELYKLNDRINQLFFGILLLNEQLIQNAITNKDIEAALKKTAAAVANGTALKSNADVLRAEIIKNNQRAIELCAMRKAYTSMLGVFTGQELKETVTLEKPQPFTAVADMHRPELNLYEQQAKQLDAQQNLISAKNLPKLGLFVQGGAGRPALNMLSNKFEPYYLGGLRLNWSLSGFYTSKREKSIIDIKRKTIDLQKETFLFNTNLIDKQQNADLNKWASLLQTDDEMIALRTNIKNAAAAQLENGVITSSDFIRELNAEDQARQNKTLHEIQLLLTQYSIKWNTGN